MPNINNGSTPKPLKYPGGKAYLAKHIHRYSPPSVNDDKKAGYTHRNIPFAGGLGELWDWEFKGISEAVNDLDQRITNLWKVLQSKRRGRQLHRLLEATPLSQIEFERDDQEAVDSLKDEYDHDVLWAWRFFIRVRQSRTALQEEYCTPTKRVRRGMHENCSSWLSSIAGLPFVHDRLKRVEVRNMNALPFIATYDHERAFFYCDPPYVPHSRTSKKLYRHEMNNEEHRKLCQKLCRIKGWFMLSGYRNEIYDHYAREHRWTRIDLNIDNKMSSSKRKPKKVECLWLNYKPSEVEE